MAVQSIASEDLFEGLPSLIGLPRCVPERRSYRKTPFREVCVPEELPPYLLLGSLDRSAFRSTDDGWSARWNGDTPETFVEARYERAPKRLQLHQVWRGINGGTSFTSGDDAGPGIQMLYMPFPEIWDHGLAQRLESAYRLKYLPGRDQYGFTGIPDGGFKTIDAQEIETLHRAYWCGTPLFTTSLSDEETSEAALRERARRMVEAPLHVRKRDREQAAQQQSQ